jgi:hypothetical protein
MLKRHWLDLVEYVFIAGSITGTVAAITTKQGIFAVTPLTIAIGLNVINRQRFNQLSQKQVEHLQQLIQHNQESQNQTRDNSTLTSEVGVLKNQIKQFDKILEYLNNTKAEKEEILEIDRITRQLQESQQDKLQNQQQIEELKVEITHSNHSINSLAKQLSEIDNSTLTSEVELLKNQIKQFDNILEHLNNTKAEKEEILEIDRITKQLQESQQKVIQFLNSISKDNSSSKDSDRLLDLVEKLTSFLKNRNWKEANQETARILLRLAGKQSHKHLNGEDLKKLLPEELNILNQLWSTYSNGRFSWLVQKQIWEELGGQARVFDLQMYEKWSKQVGWRVSNQWLFYSELDFTDEAPIGHFPAIYIQWSSWGSAWCGIETVMLFSKINRTQYDEDNNTQNLKRELQEFGTNIEQEINGLGDKLKRAFNPLNDLF